MLYQKYRKWVFTVGGFIVSAIFLWFAFRTLKPEVVWIHVQKADISWLLIAIGVYFGGVALISKRWAYLLVTIQNITPKQLFPLVTIGYMGNNLYPLRSGEVLRVLFLQRQLHASMAHSTTTILIERVFDGLVMLTFMMVSFPFTNVVSPAVRHVALLSAPVFLAATGLFFMLARYPHLLRRAINQLEPLFPARFRHPIRHIGNGVIEGLESLRSPTDLAGAVVFSYAAWMVEACVYWIVSHAMDIQVSYLAILLTVGVVNLAGLIPASPGQLGVFEFFVSTTMIAVNVPEAKAYAFALVVHVVIWLPVTLVGFMFFTRQGMGWNAMTLVLNQEHKTHEHNSQIHT